MSGGVFFMASAFQVIWRHRGFPAFVILGLAFMLRIVFLNLYPLMYWHDGYHRLAYAEKLVQSLWLPLYQAGISLLAPFTRDPGNFRLMTVFQAAWAAAAGAWLLRRLGGPWAGWLAGLFLAVCPLYIFESLGLFQESLFSALLLTSACCLHRATRSGIWLGLFFLAAACLTRYESWLAALLVLAWLWLGMPGARYRPARPLVFRISATLTIVAAPLAWMIYSKGLSPIGAASLDIGLGWARIWQYLLIWGRNQLQWGGLPLLLLAACGLLDLLRGGFGVLWSESEPMDLRRRWSEWILSGQEKISNGWALLFLLYAALVFAMLVIARPFYPADSVRGAHVAILVEMVLALRGWLLLHAVLTRYAQAKEQGQSEGKPAWWNGWEVGLSWVLALVAFIPNPGYMLRSLRLATDHPMARLSGEVHAVQRELEDPIQAVLVLSEGFRAWPDAEPAAGVAVTVGLRRSHETVFVDNLVPEEALASWADFEGWLAERNITHVLKVNGFTPWRPVHLLFQRVMGTGDAPRLLRRAESFELYRLGGDSP